MTKKFHIGDIVLLPKNFPLRQYRGHFVKVLRVNSELLTLEAMSGTFEASTEDVSAKRGLNVDQRWAILNRDAHNTGKKAVSTR